MRILESLTGLFLLLPSCAMWGTAPTAPWQAGFASVASEQTPLPGPVSIVNGSFEADDWSIGKRFDLGGTGGPVTGWTPIDPLGDRLYPWGLHNGINQHEGGPTPYGTQWFVIGGPFGAGGMSVEQTVSGLTPGATYTLKFALSTEGIAGGNSRVRVSFPSGSSTSSTDITIPPSVHRLWDTWTMYALDVLAESSTLTFRFTDLGSAVGIDAGLDNVSLTKKGVDLSIDPVRVAQVVFDPDIDSDGRVDLVARKAAVAIATIHAAGASASDTTPVVVELRFGTQVTTKSLLLGQIPVSGTEVELFFRSARIGDAALTVEIDPADAIAESDESNNIEVIPTTTTPTDSFRVGYLEVRDCLLGDCYGPPQELAQTVAKSNEFILATYPVADSAYSGLVLPDAYRGAALPSLGVAGDLLQIGLWGKLADPSADRIVGIVPDDYFAYHQVADAAGVTYLDSFGGLVREGSWTTTAHVLGHMYGIDSEEYARSICNDAEGYWVTQHAPITERVCFMCSASAHDLQTHWVDQIHYHQLFERFRSLPTVGEALLVSGFLHANGNFEPHAWYVLPSATISESFPGDHAVRILNGSGQVISEVTFPVAFEMHVEPLGIQPADRVPLLVTLPYPEDSATVQIVRDDLPIESISPSIETLHDAVDAIPEDGFSNDPHTRRLALHRQIDAVQQMLNAGNSQQAENILVHRFRPRILLWLREEYAVFLPTQLTRPQVLAVVDAAIVRIGNS